MRKTGSIIPLTAAAVFYFLAVQFGGQAAKSADIGTVLLTGGQLAAEQAAEICVQEALQEEPQGICFWGETAPVRLTCQETGGNSMVPEVLTAGNPELIVPGIGALAWQQNGCFIDTETSAELFGTEQAAGQTVWCGDCSYTVCGTFQSLKNMLVRQAAEADGAVLDTLSVYLSANGARSAGGSRTEQLLMRYGLEGEKADFLFLNALMQDLLLILPLMLGGWMICSCLQQVRRAASRKERAGFLIAAVLPVWAAVCFLPRYFWIPSDMIPTRWSDFSFWQTWWEAQEKNLLLLLGGAQGEAQLLMFRNLILSFVWNLCAVFAGLFTICSCRIRGASDTAVREPMSFV